MHRTLLITLFTIACGTAPAAAQWRFVSPEDTAAVLLVDVSAEDAPEPGTRPAERLRGTVRRIAPDTLYLRTAGDSVVAVPRIRILDVEQSLGVSRLESARAAGATLAVIAGLVLLAVDDSRADVGWVRAGTIIAGAGLAGAAWGALRPWERTEPVWLPEVGGP